MQRRDFVRAMMALGLAPQLGAQQTASPAPPPPAPVPWTLGLNAKTPRPRTGVADAIADSDPIFFSAEQMASLTHLSDLLMPPLGKQPGALQAGTPAFLDFLIGNSPASRKELYQGGLQWLQAESMKAYELGFAQTNAVQADALLKPWLRSWMTDHPPTEAHASFVNVVHADVRTATMDSKAWIDAMGEGDGDWVTSGLYWSPVEPDVYAENFNGVHLRPSPLQDPPASTHMAPSYPH